MDGNPRTNILYDKVTKKNTIFFCNIFDYDAWLKASVAQENGIQLGSLSNSIRAGRMKKDLHNLICCF